MKDLASDILAMHYLGSHNTSGSYDQVCMYQHSMAKKYWWRKSGEP